MIVLKFKTEIKGNCQEKDHKDWIVIDSWGFGSGRPIAVGNDREAGVGHVTDISLSKVTDIASPSLFIESVSGKSLEEATLRIIQTSGSSTGKNEPYIEITLEHPIISGYSVSGTSDRPTENFQINFTAIKYEYRYYDAKGILQSKMDKIYDLITHGTL